MAPKRSTLQDIRRQQAARRKLTAPVMAASAYHRLERSNIAAVYGRPPVTDEGDVEKRLLNQMAQSKVKKAAPRKKTKPKAKLTATAKTSVPSPTQPKEPIVECWRSAGGDMPYENDSKSNHEASRVLGVARVPTWSLHQFKSTLSELVAHEDLQDIVSQQCMDGAEDVSDVYAVFRTESVAETTKLSIDGMIVNGRKLQVRFA